MVTGQIKLGVKELLRKSLSGDLLRGFFYGGGVVALTLQEELAKSICLCCRPTARQAPNFIPILQGCYHKTKT